MESLKKIGDNKTKGRDKWWGVRRRGSEKYRWVRNVCRGVRGDREEGKVATRALKQGKN